MTDGPQNTEHPLFLQKPCPACGVLTDLYNTSTPQGQCPVIICHMCDTRTMGRYVLDEGFSRIITGTEFPKGQEST